MESDFHMDVIYFVSDNCQMHKRALMLVLIVSIFHTFSVNSQNTFLSADFVCNKCLILIQTCSRTVLLTQNNPSGIKAMSYFNILHTFLVGEKIGALFCRLGKIDRVSHLCTINT